MNQPQWFDRLHSYWTNGTEIKVNKPIPWRGFAARLLVDRDGTILIEIDGIENAITDDTTSGMTIPLIYSALVVLSDAIAILEKKCT